MMDHLLAYLVPESSLPPAWLPAAVNCRAASAFLRHLLLRAWTRVLEPQPQSTKLQHTVLALQYPFAVPS